LGLICPILCLLPRVYINIAKKATKKSSVKAAKGKAKGKFKGTDIMWGSGKKKGNKSTKVRREWEGREIGG